MFGDYYTNTLVSGSPTTTMVGNQIEFYLLQSQEKGIGAALVLILSVLLMALMAYYLVATAASQSRRGGVSARTAPAVGAGVHHLALRRLVACPRPDRGAVLLQRRPLPDQLAGRILPVVLG